MLKIAPGLSLPVDAVTPEQVAWLAGLFEGEGCIALVKQNRGVRRALFVGSTDRDVLDKVQSIAGAGTIREMKVRGNRKRAWRWEVQDWENVCRIGRMILPHLCTRRREKMRLLLNSPPTRGVGKCRKGHALVGQTADVYLRPGRTPQCAVCARQRTAEWRKRKCL